MSVDKPRVIRAGWSGLDELYRVVPGELSVVTGVPNSGKSEWLDALLCNLVGQRGWTFALCSMENKVSRRAVAWAVCVRQYCCKV